MPKKKIVIEIDEKDLKHLNTLFDYCWEQLDNDRDGIRYVATIRGVFKRLRKQFEKGL